MEKTERRAEYEYHGMRRSSEYRTWSNMWTRVRKPIGRNAAYATVKICDRWKLFSNFLTDMGHKPGPKYSIDRIDNNGGYEPGNCRWATAKQQANNQSFTRRLTFNGKTKTTSEWAEELNISHKNILQRLNKLKWPVELALTVPRNMKLVTAKKIFKLIG